MSASQACQSQYGTAKPTPLFDWSGKPRCCGPIKVYSMGQMVEQCPPSGGGQRVPDSRAPEEEEIGAQEDEF